MGDLGSIEEMMKTIIGKFERMERIMAAQGKVLLDQHEAIGHQAQILEMQAKQLKLLRENQEIIAREYFTRTLVLVEGLVLTLGKMGEEGFSKEELDAKLDALRETLSLVGPESIAMAGEKYEKLYNEVVPALENILEHVHDVSAKVDKVDETTREMFDGMDGFADGAAGSFRAVLDSLTTNLRAINGLHQTIRSESDRVVRAARPLGSSNTYRR